MKLKPLHNKITVRLTEGRGAWRNFLSNAEGEDTDPYCCGVVETVGFAMGANIINDDGLALVQTVPIVVKTGPLGGKGRLFPRGTRKAWSRP